MASANKLETYIESLNRISDSSERNKMIAELIGLLKRTPQQISLEEHRKCIKKLLSHFYPYPSPMKRQNQAVWNALKKSELMGYCEEFEQNIQLKKECGEAQKELETRKRLELMKELVDAQQRTKSAARCKPYIKLFGGMALSLQLLMGIARTVQNDNRKDLDFLWDFFYERVIREVRFAIKKNRFTLTAESLIAPPFVPRSDAEPFDLNQMDLTRRNEYLKKQSDLYKDQNAQALKRMIEAEESKYQDAEVDFMQEKLMCDLHDLLWEWEQIQETDPADWDFVERSADTVAQILKKYHLYLLYADDERVKENPELRGRFAPASSPTAILYPGVFWENNGTLVVFGSWIGVYANDTPIGSGKEE